WRISRNWPLRTTGGRGKTCCSRRGGRQESRAVNGDEAPRRLARRCGLDASTSTTMGGVRAGQALLDQNLPDGATRTGAGGIGNQNYTPASDHWLPSTDVGLGGS